MEETLAVHRWHSDGYVETLVADRDERIRAEPFEAMDFRIGCSSVTMMRNESAPLIRPPRPSERYAGARKRAKAGVRGARPKITEA